MQRQIYVSGLVTAFAPHLQMMWARSVSRFNQFTQADIHLKLSNQGKRALFENQLIVRKKGVIGRSKQAPFNADEVDRKEERRERKVWYGSKWLMSATMKEQVVPLVTQEGMFFSSFYCYQRIQTKLGFWCKHTIWHITDAGWEGRGEGEDEGAGVRVGEGRANIPTQRGGLHLCAQSLLSILSSILQIIFYRS